MQIKTNIDNGILVINISGEVDLYSSPKLREVFRKTADTAGSHMLINLEEVSYMDSSGLATLVEAMNKVMKNNGKFILAGLHGEVKNMFEIARLTEVFSIFDDMETAMKNFNQ